MSIDDSRLKGKIEEKWDASSLTYDKSIGHGIQTLDEKQFWIDVFNNIIPDSAKTVLDVGFGTGSVGLILAEMGFDVTGIDLSEKMMEVGRQKAEDLGLSVNLVKGDAENLPFPDNSFDVLINRHLLWTLPHPNDDLVEWSRVVKPGGVVAVIDGVWSKGGISEKIRFKIYDYVVSKKEHRSNSSYSDEINSSLPNKDGAVSSKIVEYFEDAGLNDISVKKLTEIYKNQKSRMPWYQRICYTGSEYYVVYGSKSLNL